MTRPRGCQRRRRRLAREARGCGADLAWAILRRLRRTPRGPAEEAPAPRRAALQVRAARAPGIRRYLDLGWRVATLQRLTDRDAIVTLVQPAAPAASEAPPA